MLKSTIGQNNLELLYRSLLGLGIITKVVSLKCLGQTSRSIQALAMLTIFLRYMSLAMIVLRCFQKI